MSDSCVDIFSAKRNGHYPMRQVNEKNEPPTSGIDEPASQDGANCSRGGTGRGPDSHRTAFRLAGEALAEDRETAWHQHGGAGALDEAGDEQQREIWCRRAGERGQAEEA